MLRVAIIGGGPAGSACAITLLRRAPSATVDVTIIEAKAFPRSKVCGEFVSPAATRLLEGLIGTDVLRGAGARRVDRLVLECDGRECVWSMPTPAWTLSRRTLDAVMLDAAATAGAKVIQPDRAALVDYSGSDVRVRLVGGKTITCDVVVHADGSGRHDPAGPVSNREGVIGLKCFFRSPQPIEGIRMRAARGGYVGTVGVEGGLATLALVARSELLRSNNADADTLVQAMWPAFDPRWREGEWLSCGVANSRYIPPGDVRSFRVGNAAAAVEPVGGEGIGLALWSGQLLAELLVAETNYDNQESLLPGLHQVHHLFARAYRRRLRTRRPACRLAAEALMHPWLVRLIWPLLRCPAISIRPWYRLTGKPMAASPTSS
jgi:flavin-dependent dehydrogenase